MYCAIHFVQSTLCNVNRAICSKQSSICNLLSAINDLHFALCNLFNMILFSQHAINLSNLCQKIEQIKHKKFSYVNCKYIKPKLFKKSLQCKLLFYISKTK